MQLARIEAFLTVARTGNVSRAATALSLTQPALTARIKGLEVELGQELFIRSPRGMRLSEAGRTFLPYAERALAALREGHECLNQLSRDGGGRLSLGAAPDVSTYTLPAMLARYAAAHPAIAISVRTGHGEQLLELVLREDVQLAIGRALLHPAIESVRLYEDEIVLVAGPQHPWSDNGARQLRDLGSERIILCDRRSSYHELTQSLFVAAGITTPRTMELDGIEAAKRMVEHGLGVALLPHAAVRREVADGRLRLIEMEDGPPIRRPIVAFRRKDTPPTPQVDAFLAIVTGSWARA